MRDLVHPCLRASLAWSERWETVEHGRLAQGPAVASYKTKRASYCRVSTHRDGEFLGEFVLATSNQTTITRSSTQANIYCKGIYRPFCG